MLSSCVMARPIIFHPIDGTELIVDNSTGYVTMSPRLFEEVINARIEQNWGK